MDRRSGRRAALFGSRRALGGRASRRPPSAARASVGVEGVGFPELAAREAGRLEEETQATLGPRQGQAGPRPRRCALAAGPFEVQPLPEAELRSIRAAPARLLWIEVRGGSPPMYWAVMPPMRDVEVKRCWAVFERYVRVVLRRGPGAGGVAPGRRARARPARACERWEAAVGRGVRPPIRRPPDGVLRVVYKAGWTLTSVERLLDRRGRCVDLINTRVTKSGEAYCQDLQAAFDVGELRRRAPSLQPELEEPDLLGIRRVNWAIGWDALSMALRHALIDFLPFPRRTGCATGGWWTLSVAHCGAREAVVHEGACSGQKGPETVDACPEALEASGYEEVGGSASAASGPLLRGWFPTPGCACRRGPGCRRTCRSRQDGRRQRRRMLRRPFSAWGRSRLIGWLVLGAPCAQRLGKGAQVDAEGRPVTWATGHTGVF